MRVLKDKLALVTGAASGIGRALSLELAAAGARLLLVDIDAAALAETAQAARERGAQVQILVIDLADRAQLGTLVNTVQQQPGGIDILVNNAGVAYYGTSHEMTTEQLDRVLAVNFLAPLALTHQLLPLLLARDESHVLNVCSVASFVGVTRLAAYNATKFGLVGFTESLRAEYAARGLGVTALCPGLVRTRIFESALTTPGRRTPKFPGWITDTPERVARRGVRAIRRNQGFVVVGFASRLVWWIKRLVPSFFVRLQSFRRVRRPTVETPAPLPVAGTLSDVSPRRVA